MSRVKDKSVVFVGTGLTSKQASNLVSAIAKAKNDIAPLSRGTAAVTNREGIGSLLQKGAKMITGK